MFCGKEKCEIDDEHDKKTESKIIAQSHDKK